MPTKAKKQTPTPTPKGKRPVLTITLSPSDMKELEGLTEDFQKLSSFLPKWVEVPTTKAAVASWLVSRGASDTTMCIRALLYEREMRNWKSNDGDYDLDPSNPPVWVSVDTITEAEIKKRLEAIPNDPFFEALRHLLKMQSE